MSNQFFRFKQFEVWHDRCAMKVGTDGVLLGAWAEKHTDPHTSPQTILDVGTGTGLIALMLAQRFPNAKITGIEIDPDAASQATDNIRKSPFSERIEIINQDFNTYTPTHPYDLIVSNPPYFTEDKRMEKDMSRTLARHTDRLTFAALIEKSRSIINKNDGILSVIVPYTSAQQLISEAAMKELYLSQRCDIRNNEKSEFKRTLLEFSNKIKNTNPSILTIRNHDNSYTQDYTDLTKDFYLF